MQRHGTPTTIRLSPRTQDLLDAEARSVGRSRSEVLEAAVEEGIRMRTFPGIGFRGVDPRRGAWVVGTGLDVWAIIAAHRDFDRSIERVVAESHLSERQIRTALGYYERFPEETDEAIADNETAVDEYRTRFPTFEIPGA